MRVLAPICAAVLALAVVLGPTLAQSLGFLETFDGAPVAPQPYANPHNWDIITLGFDGRVGPRDPDRQTHNLVSHGPDCQAPGFPFTATNSHQLWSPADMVFLCGAGDNTHLMTATGISGYGAIYMTPPVVADISNGQTATLSIDMSTLRTSSRDWVQWVLTPDDGHHELAFISVDQHMPPNAVKIEMGGVNAFQLKERVGGREYPIDSAAATYDQVFARQVPPVQTSMARRDTFTATISRDRVSFCMPKYGFCWADARLPVPLDPAVWHDKVQLQINHVSYNAMKSCEADGIAAGYSEAQLKDEFDIVNSEYGRTHCPPTTWHWDNLSISPAIPYSVIPSVPQDFRSQSSAPFTVPFAAPAPEGARLSFLAWGDTPRLRVSLDGGQTWQLPTFQQAEAPNNQDVGEQVNMPVPAGLQSIMVQGAPSWVRFETYGFKLVGPVGGAPVEIPATPTPTLPPATATAIVTVQATPEATATGTPTPSPTTTPSPTGTPEPTLLPSPTPTAEPTLSPTPTSTPAPGAACVVLVVRDDTTVAQWACT